MQQNDLFDKQVYTWQSEPAGKTPSQVIGRALKRGLVTDVNLGIGDFTLTLKENTSPSLEEIQRRADLMTALDRFPAQIDPSHDQIALTRTGNSITIDNPKQLIDAIKTIARNPRSMPESKKVGYDNLVTLLTPGHITMQPPAGPDEAIRNNVRFAVNSSGPQRDDRKQQQSHLEKTLKQIDPDVYLKKNETGSLITAHFSLSTAKIHARQAAEQVQSHIPEHNRG